MTESETVTIYGLHLVGDSKILWVGQTKHSIEARKLWHHRHAYKSQAKAPISVWFREHDFDEIVAVELEVCDASQKIERETHWILELKTLTEHGGLNTRLSYGWVGGRPEAAAWVAKINASPEARAKAAPKIAAATRRRMEDPKVRAHLAELQHQRYEDPEERRRIGEATRIGLADPVVREKLSAVRQAAVATPEGKAHMSRMGKVGGAIGGHISGHRRWHVARGIVKDGCDLCAAGAE